jgi:hypothetical protein
MSGSTTFDPSHVFQVFAMRAIGSPDLDHVVIDAPGDDLRCVFLWGQDCYNCNMFKQAALLHQESLRELGLTWFQADVYADEALGLRFALHGVPTFVFYRGGKRLGRITSWPGLAQFVSAVKRLQNAEHTK